MNVNQLGLLLVREKVISRAQLDQAVEGLWAGQSLLDRLLQKDFVTDQVLSQFVCEKLGFPMADRHLLDTVAPELIKSVPRDLVDEYSLVPIGVDPTGLRVAMVDPTNKSVVEELKFFLGKNILAMVGNRQHIYAALNRYYQLNRAFKPVVEREPRTAPVVATTPPPPKPPPAPAPPQSPVPALQSPPPPAPPETVQNLEAEYQNALALFDQAGSRDEIARNFLRFAARILRRVAFFTVKKNVLLGWIGEGADFQQKNLKGIMIPLTSPSLFQRVYETKVYYLGEVPSTTVNQIFMTALGTLHPPNVLIIPICIRERVVCIFYGDHGQETIPPDSLHYLHLLIPKVERAFERLILTMKTSK